MLHFNDLLRHEGIDPTEVAIILHTPLNASFRRMLPWLVLERPDLFNTYQSVHSLSVEPTLKRHRFAAAFIAVDDGQMLFAGFFRREGWRDLPESVLRQDVQYNELATLEGIHVADILAERGLATRCVFDFSKQDELSEYIGRAVIAQPKGRNYVRLAKNLAAQILAISETSQLSLSPPDWKDFILSCAELKRLPKPWAERLRGWRGIYLITDESDGARYIGSAYGVDNILGRWRAHVARGKGITKDLSKRNPANFRFSILQLLAPDAEPSDVINLEHNWMDRLHTREFGLNV